MSKSKAQPKKIPWKHFLYDDIEVTYDEGVKMREAVQDVFPALVIPAYVTATRVHRRAADGSIRVIVDIIAKQDGMDERDDSDSDDDDHAGAPPLGAKG
jgi:hypothetical protein